MWKQLRFLLWRHSLKMDCTSVTCGSLRSTPELACWGARSEFQQPHVRRSPSMLQPRESLGHWWVLNETHSEVERALDLESKGLDSGPGLVLYHLEISLRAPLGNTATWMPVVNGHPLRWQLIGPSAISILFLLGFSQTILVQRPLFFPHCHPAPGCLPAWQELCWALWTMLSSWHLSLQPGLGLSSSLCVQRHMSKRWSLEPWIPNFACISPQSHLVHPSHLDQLHTAPTHFRLFLSMGFFSLLNTDLGHLWRRNQNLNSKNMTYYLSSDYYKSGTKALGRMDRVEEESSEK